MNSFPADYELIDCGELMKLERFGDHVLARPSGLCKWQKRIPKVWNKAQATFVPKKGWQFSGKQFDHWQMQVLDFSLKLRLQSNGQVGFFSEHAGYIPRLEKSVKKLATSGDRIRVLNLFAYTGMATVLCARHAEVTHVDLTKKTFEWANENLSLNRIDSKQVQFIHEDALGFMQRERRRNKKYDVIVCDPPAFSRVSAKKSWGLSDTLSELVEHCAALLQSKHGALYFTAHSVEGGSAIVSNLIGDHLHDKKPEISREYLELQESGSDRVLPAGFLVEARYGF